MLPFIVGVAGGPSAGKSAACVAIADSLHAAAAPPLRVLTLHQRNFYRAFSAADRAKMASGTFDFDHPTAFDFDDLVRVLRALKGAAEADIRVPRYDAVLRLRREEVLRGGGASWDVVLVEGIFMLHSPSVRALLDLAVFVDLDADTRLARRVLKEAETGRGEALEETLRRYVAHVKPSFEQFVQPTKINADLIVPRGAENGVAVDLIVQYIRDVLKASVSATSPAGVAASLPGSRLSLTATSASSASIGKGAKVGASAVAGSKVSSYSEIPQ